MQASSSPCSSAALSRSSWASSWTFRYHSVASFNALLVILLLGWLCIAINCAVDRVGEVHERPSERPGKMLNLTACFDGFFALSVSSIIDLITSLIGSHISKSVSVRAVASSLQSGAVQKGTYTLGHGRLSWLVELVCEELLDLAEWWLIIIPIERCCDPVSMLAV